LKVGLAGLGIIGSRVAEKLADAGSLNLVYNRTPAKAAAIAKARGVGMSPSPLDLVRECDVVFTVLSDDEAVVTFFGGISSVPVQGKTFLDMSTIGPSTSVALASGIRRSGGSMLDVPVVGSASMVEKKEAVLMVGGEAADFERVSPLLHQIANVVLHVGPNGTGLKLKLVHNLVLASYVVALGEAVNFGLSGGLDPKMIEQLLVSLSSIRSPGSALKVPKIIGSDYAMQFSLKHMIKDLGIIEAEARRQRSPIPMGSLALQLYRMAEKRGLAEKDFSAVAELFKESSSQPAR
jgi:3-hydroxyisobutyrate dehydrogenase